MKKRFSALSLIIACLAGILIAALGAGIYFVISFGGFASYKEAVKFASVYNILETMFVGDADMNAVSEAAFDAMVEAIDDRWSYYMTEEEYESYKDFQKNSYTGIGVTIEVEEGSSYLRVRGITEDSPADRAGIDIGDYMYAIDGVSLEGKSATDVKALIVEKGGGEFELSLLGSDGKERTVRISAERIFSNPVEYYMLPDSIGYIRIKNFEGESGSRAIAAIEDLIEQGAKGLVFDVRNNPGGLLTELTELLDYILPEGDLFVSVTESGLEMVTSSDARCVELPMTVLMNADSYSAAEFFAAALWEYGIAETVGEATTGKSRSQVNLLLPDGSAVHLSTNGYLTPNRIDLAEQGGLVPDHEVQLSEDDRLYQQAGRLPPEDDGQLQTAHTVLSAKLAA